MRRNELCRAFRLAGRLCVRVRRSSRRSKGLWPADTRSSSAARGRPRNRRPAGRSSDTPRARAWRRWPTRERSARTACGCRRAPSVRDKPCRGAGRRRACLSCAHIGSWSLHQTVFEPSACSSISKSTGRNVAGRWCCGQLNSMPPEIHGPAKPTSAGLMTGWW